MTRNERIEGIDPAIGSERNLTVDHLSSQSDWRAMRLQGRAAVPGLDIVQEQAQGSSEGPTSFVFCSAPPERKSVPDKLKVYVDALDDDNFEKRQKASNDLVRNATLKELLDLKEVPGLSLEQRRRIEKATREAVENVFKKFQEDPRKNKLDSSDDNVNAALLSYAPRGTFDTRQAVWKISEAVYAGGAQTVKEYNDHIKKSEGISALADWVVAVYRKEGASADLKEAAGDFWVDGACARDVRMRAHAALGEGDPKVVSDAGTMSREERNSHAKVARAMFMEDVRSGHFYVRNSAFGDSLVRYLNDKSVPSAEFARTLETIAKKTTSERFDFAEPSLDPRPRFMEILMALNGLSPEKARAAERQTERLSQDLESRIKKIEDPKLRCSFELHMVSAYHQGNQIAKAQKMYLQTLETAKLLPEDERKDAIDYIKNQWGRRFDKN